jgi:hypothetical protein
MAVKTHIILHVMQRYKVSVTATQPLLTVLTYLLFKVFSM